MRLMSRSFTTAAVMYAVTAPASAQNAHPNYAGTWVMDASRSENSTGGLPTSYVWTVQQHGDTIIVDRELVATTGPVKSHIVVATDGRAYKNIVPQPGAGDVETSSTASWEAGGLVVKTSGNLMGTDFVQTDRWTLSADGKALVSHRSVVTVADGNEVQTSTYTFNKKN